MGITIILILPNIQVISIQESGSLTTIDESPTSNVENDDLLNGQETDSLTRASTRVTIDRVIPDSKVMYAIIAPQQFKDTLIPLVNWKTYKGVPAKIFTLESIYADYTTGRDDAENLHKFLRDLDAKSPELTWLLLAGDADVVPVRKLWAEAYQYNFDDTYFSDYYYAGLENDWDKNNDGVYGDGTIDGAIKFEGDWSPDVYVGRLPVGDITELNGSVQDILDYETNPPVGNWVKRVVLWGGLMDAPNDPVYYDSYDTNGYKAKELYVKPIIEDKAGHMFITTRYDYPQLEGGNYKTSTDGLDQPLAIQDMNLGASLVNFAGQAYYEGTALIDYDDPAGKAPITGGGFASLYRWENARDATNGKKLPLATFFTCSAANFSSWGAYEDKTLERLLTAQNGGAIGLVGSTGKTYRGEYQSGRSEGNWWMDKKFYEIFFDGTYQPGKCFYDMKWKYKTDILDNKASHHEVFKAMLFAYNYQGDPELNIWTDEPSTLKVDISGLWLGPHNFTATVYDMADNVVPNARVSIQNNELYVYGVTNATGQARIYANPTQLTSVDVVVTAHNFLPLEETFQLGIEPVDLTVTTQDIGFSAESPIVHQQITISANILNRGKTDLTSDVKVRFSVDGLVGAGGTIISTDQIISGLNVGNKKPVQVTWSVVPGQHKIWIEIDPENEISESYEWNNIANKSIYVRKPELFLTTDDISFTPNYLTETIYEGKPVEVKATIHNNGEAPVYDVRVDFIDRSESMLETSFSTGKIISVIDQAEFETVTAIWTAVGGEHEIIVKIDPLNSITEFNETNNSASKSISIKYPPVIGLLPDLELFEDTSLENATNLVYYVYDNDTKLPDLIITLNSTEENCSVILNEYYHLDVFAHNDWYGVANVTITVSDGLVVVNDTFKITVKPKSDAPRFSDNNFTIYATEELELSYFVIAYDPDGESITFSDDIELFDIDPNSGEIRFIPTQDHVNNSPYNFNITISDGQINAQKGFKLIIANVPDPPIILPIPDQSATANELFTLKIEAYDIDSPKIYFNDDSVLFVININTGIISFTPNNSDADMHTIKIIVSDDDYLAANTTFKLTINTNTSSDDNGGSDDGEDDDSSWIFGDTASGLVIIIVVIIVIIMLLALFLFRRRKKLAKSDDYFTPGDKAEKTTEHDLDIDDKAEDSSDEEKTTQRIKKIDRIGTHERTEEKVSEKRKKSVPSPKKKPATKSITKSRSNRSRISRK